MRKLLASFAQLLLDRSIKNISNSDPNLGPNFGFISGKAVEIDFGNYQKLENSKQQRKELSHFLMGLESWLHKRAPEYYQDAIDLRIKVENAIDAIE